MSDTGHRFVLVAHSDPPMLHLICATLRVVGFDVEACAERDGLERDGGDAEAIVVDGRLDGLRPDDIASFCARVAPEVPLMLVCGAQEDVDRMHTPASPRLQVLAAPFAPMALAGSVADLTTRLSATG